MRGDWRRAYLLLENFLHIHPKAAESDPIMTSVLLSRPVHEALSVFFLLTRAGNRISGLAVTQLLRQLKWQQSFMSSPRSFRAAQSSLSTLRHLITSRSIIQRVHVDQLVHIVLYVLLPDEVGVQDPVFLHLRDSNLSLLNALKDLCSALSITMNDSWYMNVINVTGRVGDPHLVREMLNQMKDIDHCLGSSRFGSFLVALGRSKMSMEVQYYWKKFAQVVSTPEETDWKALAEASAECDQIAFLNDQLNSHLGPTKHEFKKYFEEYALRWRKGVMSRNEKRKKFGIDWSRVKSAHQYIEDLAYRIYNLIEQVKSGEVYDMKNNPAEAISGWSLDAGHEERFQHLSRIVTAYSAPRDGGPDPISKQSPGITQRKTVGKAELTLEQDTRTNFTLSEYRNHVTVEINHLLLRAWDYDDQVGRPIGLHGSDFAEYHRHVYIKPETKTLESKVWHEDIANFAMMQNRFFENRIKYESTVSDEEWVLKTLEIRHGSVYWDKSDESEY